MDHDAAEVNSIGTKTKANAGGVSIQQKFETAWAKGKSIKDNISLMIQSYTSPAILACSIWCDFHTHPLSDR